MHLDTQGCALDFKKTDTNRLRAQSYTYQLLSVRTVSASHKRQSDSAQLRMLLGTAATSLAPSHPRSHLSHSSLEQVSQQEKWEEWGRAEQGWRVAPPPHMPQRLMPRLFSKKRFLHLPSLLLQDTVVAFLAPLYQQQGMDRIGLSEND